MLILLRPVNTSAWGASTTFADPFDALLSLQRTIVVTTPAAQAVKNATTTIPIVHPAAIDPVGTGLIASLAHPGGNLTGLSVLNAELSAKRLELLREIVPGLSRGAVLWNVANPATASLGEIRKPRHER